MRVVVGRGGLLEVGVCVLFYVCVRPVCWRPSMVAGRVGQLLGRSPPKNCKNDLDDQT